MTTALASSTVEHTSAAPPLAKPIYDVVQLVRPGTPCSTPPGRWHTGVAFWTAKAAREIVAVYNRHISDQIPPGGSGTPWSGTTPTPAPAAPGTTEIATSRKMSPVRASKMCATSLPCMGGNSGVRGKSENPRNPPGFFLYPYLIYRILKTDATRPTRPSQEIRSHDVRHRILG